jgi:hypothetical protein
MDFVADYDAKKRLVEQLKRRETALSKVDTGPSSIVTPASGAFPGMTQANWGGALAKLAQGYLGGKATEDEAAATTDAENSRLAAIQNLLHPQASAPPMGQSPGIDPVTGVPSEGTPQPAAGASAEPDITPDMLVKLQHLGVDPRTITPFIHKPTPLAAKAQAAATKAGRKVMVLSGDMTQAESDALDAQDLADEQRKLQNEKDLKKYEAGVAYHAPPGLTAAEQEKWMYEHDRPNWELRYGKSGAAGKSGNVKLTPAEIVQRTRAVVSQLKGLTERKEGDPMGKVDTYGNIVGSVLDEFNNPLSKAAGSMMSNATGIQAKNLRIDAVINEVQKLVPASNADFSALLGRYTSVITNPKAFAQFAQDFEEKMAKNFDANGKYIGVDADKAPANRANFTVEHSDNTTQDDEIDRLMGKKS